MYLFTILARTVESAVASTYQLVEDQPGTIKLRVKADTASTAMEKVSDVLDQQPDMPGFELKLVASITNIQELI